MIQFLDRHLLDWIQRNKHQFNMWIKENCFSSACSTTFIVESFHARSLYRKFLHTARRDITSQTLINCSTKQPLVYTINDIKDKLPNKDTRQVITVKMTFIVTLLHHIFHLPVKFPENVIKIIHSISSFFFFSFCCKFYEESQMTGDDICRISFASVTIAFYVNVLPSATTIKGSHLALQLSPPLPQTLTQSPSSTPPLEPFPINHDSLLMSWWTVFTVI